jgi:hypothetical protein
MRLPEELPGMGLLRVENIDLPRSDVGVLHGFVLSQITALPQAVGRADLLGQLA